MNDTPTPARAPALMRLGRGLPRPAAPQPPASADAAQHDLRGGLATWLGCIYIVVLIPSLIGSGPNGQALATVAGTAFACVAGTLLFALLTRLPFAVGPGIVPTSIVASFLADGVPWGTVLGIELAAGLLFAALVWMGAVESWVRRMPPVLKTAGQIAIGLYLFLAALRAAGLVDTTGTGLHDVQATALAFAAGLALAFGLSITRWRGHAVLAGVLLAAAGAWALGGGQVPQAAWAAPTLAWQWPDLRAALSWQHVDKILILLYVGVVDVVATLETLGQCAPSLCGPDGRLQRHEAAMKASALVFVASPFVGTTPMLVFFESLGGVLSGARRAWAALVAVAGFGALMVFSPLAAAVPALACAVALAYIGYAIAKHAVPALPLESRGGLARVARHMAGAAVVLVFVTQSVALTLFALFALYPLSARVCGLALRRGDIVAAAVGAALTMTMLA